MNADPNRDGLREALESLIGFESGLDQILAGISDETKGYLEAPAVIGQLQSLATRHREALEGHLQELGDTGVPPVASSISAALEIPAQARDDQGRGAVSSLRVLASALTECAFAYVAAHAVAHRAYRVATADLADQHRRDYLGAAQAIHETAGDVAIQELQDAGHECRCECPACGSGICLCWHVHVDPELTGAPAPREGIVVREPRAGSNAAQAGLRHGDVILSVGDKEVGSYQDMLDRMREHEPGLDVKLLVRRGADDPRELNVTR